MRTLYGLWGHAVAGAAGIVPSWCLSLKGTRTYKLAWRRSANQNHECFYYCYTPEFDLFWHDSADYGAPADSGLKHKPEDPTQVKRPVQQDALIRQANLHNSRLLGELATYSAYLGRKDEPGTLRRMQALQV
jgi:hypothetical protein